MHKSDPVQVGGLLSHGWGPVARHKPNNDKKKKRIFIASVYLIKYTGW
jgi:hypothetical protein